MSDDQPGPSDVSPMEPSSIEQLSPGVKREWLFAGKIVVYTVTDSRRESVDAWISAFKSDLMGWSADRPFLLIHDISVRDAAATPYLLARVQEMVLVRPDVRGRAAIILPGNFVDQMIRIFLDRQEKRVTHIPRERKIFASREQAIAWLLS